MYITLYSQIFWIRLLISITCLFSVFKQSHETSPVQNVPNGNSYELINNSEVHNLNSQELSLLNVLNTTDSSSPQADDGLFNWNNSSMTAADLQSFYCSRHCGNIHMVTPPWEDWWFYMQCFPCDCINPLCELYGTCCRDYYMSSVNSNSDFDEATNWKRTHWPNYNVDERAIHASKDTSMEVVCEGDGNENYLSKRSCLANYPDGDVKTKCLNDIPKTEKDLDTFLHVTDNVNEHTYYNIYCATCNNASQFTRWTLSVECKSYMTVYSSRTPGELFRLSLASDSGCNTRQTPSDGFLAYRCNRVWFSTAVVDTCNVTGEWRVYDDIVVRACADISGVINRVQIYADTSETVYKNIFCAICNFDIRCQVYQTQNGSNAVLSRAGPIEGWYVEIDQKDHKSLPFSILLNFGTYQRRDFIKCSQDSEWASPDNKCLLLQCSPGKILTNGSCSTALSEIRGLVYQIHIYYVPSVVIEMTLQTEQVSHIQQTYLNVFKRSTDRVVGDAGETYDISLTVVFLEKTLAVGENQTDEQVNKSRVFIVGWFTVEGFIEGDHIHSRDDVEIFIVNELILNNITVDIDSNTTLTLMPVLIPHSNHTQTNCNSDDKHRYSCIPFSLTVNHNDFKHVSEMHMQKAIIIEPHLNCAFLQFDKTKYLYQSDITSTPQSYSITLYFKGTRMMISDRTELNMVSIDENGTVRICQELLDTVNLISDKVNNSFLQMCLYVLTLICIISSIIFLAISLMTYFLFPVLRSVAGKNNMFLCLSLLMAQLSLLATSHIPEASHICTILAVCTHFLWLSMFCWCFACCFHMFCVFSAKTRSIQSTANSEMTYVIRRVVACSVIPGLTVAGVITTNYTISGGQFIGYGNTTCFIDSYIILVSTLVAPLCLILLLNFIFFLITIIKIYNVHKLQTREFRKDDRSNLYIYIKLSSMTGIFWILSVISEATDNDPLRVIAIVLNGLQGVFIFLSYICNRRVLNLYLKYLGLEQYLDRSSFSGSSTIAKVVTGMDKQSHGCEDRGTVQ